MAINVYLRGKGTSLQGLRRATSSYSTLKKIAGEWTKDPEKIGKIASAMHTGSDVIGILIDVKKPRDQEVQFPHEQRFRKA